MFMATRDKQLRGVILILLSTIFGANIFAQQISPRSSDVITVLDGNLFAKNSFRPAVFSDTLAANSVTTLDSCGKLIFTYDINGYWQRACNPKRWEKVVNARVVDDTLLIVGSDTVVIAPPSSGLWEYDESGNLIPKSFPGDSLKLTRKELVLENNTKDSLGGLLTNIGNGATEFRKLNTRLVNDTTLVSGTDSVIVSPNNFIKTTATSVRNGDILISNSVLYNMLSGFFTADFNDTTTPDDSAMVIVSASGVRLKRIFEDRIYPEWFGAVGNGTTNDAPAFNKMFRWIEGSMNNVFTISHLNKNYRLNDTVFLPSLLAATQTHARLIIDGGSGVSYNKTTPGPMLYRIPPDMSQIASYIGAYFFSVENIRFSGNLTTSQVAIKAAAFYTPTIKNCYFYALDTAVVAPFWLNAKIQDNFFVSNLSVAFIGTSGTGYWPGANDSNTSFNACELNGNRVFNRTGSFAGLFFVASDGLLVSRHISEGQNPLYDIYINLKNSSTVNGNTLENIWFESTGGAYAENTAVKMENFAGSTLRIKNIQNNYADTLLQVRGVGGSNCLVIEGIDYWPQDAIMIDAAGGEYNTTTLTVSNMRFNFSERFVDTSYYAGNKVAFRTTVYNATGIKTAGPAHLYSILPHAQGGGNRLIAIAGSLDPFSNGSYDLGLSTRRYRATYSNRYIANNNNADGYRFRNDSGGVLSLGMAYLNDTTLSLLGSNMSLPGGNTSSRQSSLSRGIRYNTDSSQLEINVGGSNWRTVALTRNNYFTADQPSGYTSNINGSLSDNDWVTKRYLDSIKNNIPDSSTLSTNYRRDTAIANVRAEIEGLVISSGTVTSVALSAPDIFSVSGSPVTSSGTLGLSLASQSEWTVFARGSGSGTPSFQALNANHIPSLAISKITDLDSILLDLDDRISDLEEDSTTVKVAGPLGFLHNLETGVDSLFLVGWDAEEAELDKWYVYGITNTGDTALYELPAGSAAQNIASVLTEGYTANYGQYINLRDNSGDDINVYLLGYGVGMVNSTTSDELFIGPSSISYNAFSIGSTNLIFEDTDSIALVRFRNISGDVALTSEILVDADDYARLFTRQTATWSSDTVTVNVNSGGQLHATISASGTRTLAFSNLNTGDIVKISINNTSGGAVTLNLPSNSFVQNKSTGVYESETDVSLLEGRTILYLVDYDGTNHLFNY